jgi:hypothetical protein
MTDIGVRKQYRELLTVSTKQDNFFQRTSSMPHARQVTTKPKYVSESKRAMITVTTL